MARGYCGGARGSAAQRQQAGGQQAGGSEQGGSERRRSDVAERLADVVRSSPAGLSVAIRAGDGWRWSHDAQRVTRAASTVKIPVLLAVLRLVEQGLLDLAEPVALPAPSDRVGGAGALALLPSVRTLSLAELLRLMVALSDNDAANAVLDHTALLQSGVVPALLAEVPTAHTVLRRRLMDTAAAAAGVENETCAADLADLLAALRAGRLLGPEATHTAIEVLRTRQARDGLPAYLAPDVAVASKPGDLVGLRLDAAVVERGGRWVAAAVIGDGLAERDVDRGTAVLPVFAAVGELAARLLDPRLLPAVG